MKKYYLLIIIMTSLAWSSVFSSSGLEVKISNEIDFIDVKHKGKIVRIQRDQSSDNTINPDYAKTSRKCPPFCIQPGKLAEGVETIGELEILDYLVRSTNGDSSILVVDSRTEGWGKERHYPWVNKYSMDLIKTGSRCRSISNSRHIRK